jgi:hypothetical protein
MMISNLAHGLDFKQQYYCHHSCHGEYLLENDLLPTPNHDDGDYVTHNISIK